MAKKNPAIVTINREWVETNDYVDICKPALGNISGNVSVQATDHSLSDFSFVEVELRPPIFKGGWLKLSIPRSEVVSIIVLEKLKDASRIGFTVRKTTPARS